MPCTWASRPSRRAPLRGAFAAVALACAGCGVQVTSGVASARGDSPEVPLSLGAMTHVPRIRQGFVGARLGMVFDHGAAPKHAVVQGGYELRIFPGTLVVQPALELGAGSPVSRSWEDPGAYLGISAATRFRLFGTGEEPATYNAVATALDFVVLPRAGGWMPPEGSGSAALAGEWAVEGGLRFTFGSDLFSPPRGRVEERETTEEGR